ncbi:hypothetical protein [Nostoc sp. CCY 9925]|uniref:hypothetical protein n=1 Tax=Nostoc sp. CCY 9925 TaxID=3103865 RepID=UPI0039C719DA
MTALLTNVTLTDALVVTFNLTGDSNGTKYKLLTTAAVGNSRTINYVGPTPADNEEVTFEIIQDSNGSRTVTWGSAFAFGTDIASITLTTTANKRDFVTARWNSDLGKFLIMRAVKGF